MEKYNNLSMSQSRAMRLLLANAAKCEPDKQGRFLIPTELRDYANIRQNVVFLGQGNHAEIWDAEAYEAMEAEMLTPENLAAAMEELGFCWNFHIGPSCCKRVSTRLQSGRTAFI